MEKLKLYNIGFPFWIMMWLPGIWWILLIPLDYLLDYLVLFNSTGQLDNRKEFCRKHTWKICLAGFASDLAGGLFMLAVLLLASQTVETLNQESLNAFNNFSSSLMFAPLHHPLALAVTVLGILIAAILIFLLDRRILQKAGLTAAFARRAALRLAVVTAPYTFLIPLNLFFD